MTQRPKLAFIGTGGTIASVGRDSLDVLDYTATGTRLSADEMRVQLFASGPRIYQATLFGPKLPPEVVAPFFTGMHLGR